MYKTKHNKAQVSVELLAIVGFMLAIITPVLFFSYTNSIEINKRFNYQQSEQTLNKVKTAIMLVGSGDKGSSMKINVNIPPSSSLKTISISNGSLIVIKNPQGEIATYVPFKIHSEEIKEGTYTLTITNKGSYIEMKK